MAKKIKKVVIVDQELTPTTLAILDKKRVHFFSLLILLAIFGSFIYYLPDISLYVDNYLHPELNQPTNSNKDKTHTNIDNPVEIEHYEYKDDLEISNNKFKLSTFTIIDASESTEVEAKNNELSITIENLNKRESLDLDDYNYYLGIYSAEDTLLQRIKVGHLLVGAGDKSTVSYKIEAAKADIAYFTFNEIGIDEYPAYTAVADKDGEGILKCTKDYETVKYLLKDNLVYSIEDVYTVPNTDPEYVNYLSRYQSLSTTYNNLPGVDSDVRVENNTLEFSTVINLSAAKSSEVNDITYEKDTDAKVMRFELVSQGYKCD